MEETLRKLERHSWRNCSNELVQLDRGEGAFTVRIITSLVSGRLVDISEDKPDTPELVLLLKRVKVW